MFSKKHEKLKGSIVYLSKCRSRIQSLHENCKAGYIYLLDSCCVSKKYPCPTQRGFVEIPRREEVGSKAKIFKGMYD